MTGASRALKLDLSLAPVDALHAMLEVQPNPAYTVWCEVQVVLLTNPEEASAGSVDARQDTQLGVDLALMPAVNQLLVISLPNDRAQADRQHP